MDKDAAVDAECTPDGYKLYDVYSLSGTTLMIRSNIIVKQVDAPTWCSFELSEWILISGYSRIGLAIVYRPPYFTRHPVTISSFVSEFSQYFESFVLCTEPILLCGDYNIQVDVKDNPNVESFLDLIDSLERLVQHVHFATHVQGHTLDLVITRKMDSIIQVAPISGSFLSDHTIVLFNLKGSKSESSAKEVWFQKIKSINRPKFKNDLRTSELQLNTPKHLVDLVN